MLKLIASDIDGTLLPPGGKSPSPELVEVLTKYLDSGAIVTLASGRPLSGLVGIFPTLKDRLTYICSNGTHIAHRGDTASVSPLATGAELADLLRIVRSLRCDFMVDTTEDTLVEKSISAKAYQAIAASGIRVRTVEDISVTPLPALKVSIACPGDPASLMKRPDIARLADKYTLVTTGNVFFDITTKDIDKGTAVVALQRRFGIKPEETIVFGDAMNDVPMFSTTPNSYAVDNAADSVRAQAAHTILPPERDGVAKCLLEWRTA